MANFAVNTALAAGGDYESPGPLQNLLTALGRPGYAIRNLLVGDLEGAFRQSAAAGNQIGGALLTGGASLVAPELSPLGMLGQVAGFDVQDVAPRETELEFSDVLRKWGAPAPEEDSWAEFGVDLAGGILTDPLTLLSGGTASVGKGVLAGASRKAAQSTLLRGFGATAGGKAALRSEVEGVLQGVFGRAGFQRSFGQLPAGAAGAVADQGAEALRQFGVNLTPDLGRRAGTLVEAARRTAAEQLLKGQLRGSFQGPLPRRLLGTPGGADLAEQAAGIAAEKGLLHRAAVRVPGFEQVAVPRAVADVVNPFNRRIFGALGGGAVAGPVGAAVGTALARWKPIDDALSGIGSAVKTRIYDKFSDGVAPAGLQRTARALSDQARGRLGGFAREWERLAQDLEPEQLNAATDALEDVHAEILQARKATTKTGAPMPDEAAWRDRLRQVAAAKPELAQLDPARREAIFDLHLKSTREELDELVSTGGASGGFRQRAREPRPGDVVRIPRPDSLPASVLPGEDMVDATVVHTNGPRPVVRIPDPNVAPFLQTHEADAIERIVRTPDGSSPYRPEELFYVERRYQPWIEEQLGDDAKRRFRGYLQKREIGTRQELLQDVEKKLVDAGKGDVLQRDLYQQHGPLVRSLADLSISRYARHTEDMFKLRLGQAADGVEAWQPYVQRVTQAIKPGLHPKVRQALGRVNHAWKGLLTTANPAFHARNYLSTLFQALHDPEISAAQALGTWIKTGLEAPLAFGSYVMRAAGVDVPAPELGELAKLARGSYLADSDPGFQALRQIKVGRFTGDQVARMARGSIVRQGQVEREVIGDLMSDDLVDALRTGKHKGKLGKLVASGNDVARDAATYFEDRARLGAFTSLLRAGVEPDEAIHRVGKAFVEYDFQSTADYYARQLLPFIRFTTATTPVAVEATIKRPALRNLGRAAIADDEEAPDSARRGFALPLEGGQYLAGLGLPSEAADQALRSLLPTPGVPHAPELRRGMAQVHPLLTGPFQYATGRNLYSGAPFPLGRSIQPGAVADVAEQLGAGQRDVKTGKVRLDPGLSAALESSPLSRQGADVLRAANFEGSSLDWVIQQATGLRTVSAGDKRDMRRLIETYLQDKVNQGDAGVFSRFFARDSAQADPELLAALKALQALKE